MSSKVVTPEQNLAVAPMVFRQVGQASEEKPQAEPRASDSAPDYAAEIAQLQRQAEQKAREAHAAGVKEGEAAGRNRAAAELQPVIDRLSRAVEEIALLRPRLRREAETDMVKLSLAIARRILRRELAVDPEALHGLVLAALEKLQGQEICRVKVHPSLAASVTACLRKGPAGAAVEVVADPSAQPGGVVFETGRGNLDASVETQFQEIERGLTDRLRRPS
jgi:flagellar assembly protein FliH